MRRRGSRFVPMLVFAVLAGTAHAAAPLGGEFQVNSYTAGNQAGVSIAVAPSGAFLVVWLSGYQDGTSSSVFGQRFNTSGAKVGSELLVNSYTSGSQTGGRVVAEDDGDFIVVWDGFGKAGEDAFGGIGVRRFNSAGATIGAELRVSTYSETAPTDPAVAVDGDGDFVVVWDQNQDPSAFGFGIFGRRFSSAGAALGVEFRVTDHTSGLLGRPSIAMESNGDFAVAWNTPLDGGSGGLGGSDGVMARRFSSAGARLASEFLVNSYTWYAQRAPAIAMDDTGSFVVVWTSNNQDGSSLGVFGQRFDSDGGRVGAEFRVNTVTYNSQYTGAAAATNGLDAVRLRNDGAFIVAWTSRQDGGFGDGIFAQRFAPDGSKIGIEFQVNVFTTGNQVHAAVGLGPGAGFVVAWNDLAYHDGEANGVFARRFGAGFPSTTPADITGDGDVDPLTDGLLVLRWLFGFSGSSLTFGAVEDGCFRCDPAGIDAYLDTLAEDLDIDDNGAVNPLTDGLLVLRRMFGFSGASLTAGGAVALDCQRCDPGDIAAYIDGLFQ